MNFSDIKSQSRKQLEGNWLKSAATMLVMFIVMMVLYKLIDGLLSQILMIPILASVTALLFRVANNEGLDFKKFTLTKSEYIRFFVFKILIIAIQFLVGIVAVLVISGGLMLSFVSDGPATMLDSVYASMNTGTVVIAIVAYIALTAVLIYIDLIYSMTPYIIFRKNEDMDAISAMRCSRELVKGYKWNLFLFELSFIGWGILAVLTAGIGFLFLAPYYEVSLANYYLELVKAKEEYAREKGIIDRERETYYRTFVEEDGLYERDSFANTDTEVKSVEDKKEDPMNALTVEKLTTIEGYEADKDKKDESKN